MFVFFVAKTIKKAARRTVFSPRIDTDGELRSSGTDIRVGGKAAICVYPW
jgi:hypothetical protein